ncbi:hypothetical protein ILYODFUR_027033 [Ilyodon furcidens]|uniref:Uncharacterized protein n=1 Tax=Ilyodon furcidens TaxID=33524 RepID=A0ABV0ST31_9TELE
MFATTYPSMVCYHNSQQELQLQLLPQLPAGIAADRKGRRSSDVTVDYIRAVETPTIAFRAGNWDRLPRNGSVHPSGEETPTWVSFILPLAKFMKEVSWDKKTRKLYVTLLYRSKTWI